MIQKHKEKINIGIAILAVLLIFTLAMVPAQGATKKSKTGWKKSGSYTYYYYKNGKYYKNRFATIKGSKYFFDEKGRLVKGHFSHEDNYYYSDASSGKVKTTAGFVKYDGNRYYVTKGGTIYTGHTLKLKGKRYKAYATGRLGTGVFKYGTVSRFYADSNGVVKTTPGFVNYNGDSYYVNSEGKIEWGHTFKVSGYTYKAYATGRLGKGIFKYGSNYYYGDSNCRVKTTKGWISYDGKRYYAASGGKIYQDQFITVSGDRYYASSTGVIQTGSFKVDGKKYKTTSTGRIIELNTGKAIGIDVSYFQYEINWKKVKASGVKFAIIRCGYRGSTNGKLCTDSTFMRNIKGAKAAGIDVGVYFFTEAINAKEGKEEADFCIKQIKKSGVKVTYPVVIDTENLAGARASSSRLSKTKRTEAVQAFCKQVKAKGYTPMIYASTSWLNNQLNMSKLSDYYVWVAQYYKKVTYGGSYKCWQYTSSGKVNGISTRVDMDYWYY